MRVMITRPREDAEPLAGLLRARGVETLVEPLLSVVYLDGPSLDLEGVQALLVTSANGARALGRRMNGGRRMDGRDLKVFAVGEASARAALEIGFTDVESAAGDVHALAGLARSRLDPADGALYHAAGSRLAGDLAGMLENDGFECRRQVLYEVRQSERLSSCAVQAIKEGSVDGILFYSPRTAETFVGLALDAGLAGAFKGIAALCLSQAVAEKAGSIDWRELCVAERPDQAAMVDVVVAQLERPAAGVGT